MNNIKYFCIIALCKIKGKESKPMLKNICFCFRILADETISFGLQNANRHNFLPFQMFLYQEP